LSVRGIECSGVVFSLRVRPRRVSARQPTYFLTSESRQRPPPIRRSWPAAPDRTALRCSRLGASNGGFKSAGSLRIVLEAAHIACGDVQPRCGSRWVSCESDRVDGSPIAPDGPVHRASPRRCRFSPDSNGRTPGSTAGKARRGRAGPGVRRG